MKRSAMILVVLAIWLVMLVVRGTPAYAQGEIADARATLKGLPGVAVEVEISVDGLTKSLIQHDVELQLRAAGIRVLSRAERLATAAKPWLYVRAVATGGEGSYAAWVGVDLQQVSVLADGGRAMAATWSTLPVVGILEGSRLPSVRGRIRQQVGEFINAWLAVNARR